MAQTVWYFDTPTIRWCTVHETTKFRYDHCRGVICDSEAHGEGCNEECWIDFSSTLEAEHDAQEHGRLLNTWVECTGCSDNIRESEIQSGGLCENCMDAVEEDEENNETN